MRTKLTIALLIAAGYAPTASTQSSGCPATAPKEAVEALWNSAPRGELLNPKGWTAASALFTQPSKPLDSTVVEIVSDYYGVNSFSINGTSAVVEMEFTGLGKLDSALLYTPPRETRAYKTSKAYHLAAGPRYMMVYGSDGKTLTEKKEIPGVTVWRIEGAPSSPWATVNSAIRYLLEVRKKNE
jgi:hypothetical protein